MKIKLITIFLLLFSLFSVFNEEKFTFSSDTTRAVLAKGKERTVLTGNAQIISGSTKIVGNRIELYGEDFRFALCNDNVKVTDDERGIILTSQNLFYDRDDKVSRVKGYCEMQDLKNEMIVKGGFLEDRGGEENVTIIQIGVRIIKVTDEDEMICRSEFARYIRDDELLELSGMPHVYWKGDEYEAAKITINLETDEITLEGKVSGTIVSEDKEEETDSTNVENEIIIDSTEKEPKIDPEEIENIPEDGKKND